ncbi:hypothetical protein P3680_23770 [Vibrio parahaemolyticus]|nr:hypothetical protein [Vibrio parahaemolyticus]MDF5446416.1 hypothetical protein [Vibrio parahaemolyticus]MDF5446605.1 hypothetical protein [Vibrio parahaemolyticus]
MFKAVCGSIGIALFTP